MPLQHSLPRQQQQEMYTQFQELFQSPGPDAKKKRGSATTANAAPANPDMTGPRQHMNDWSWSAEEESAFSSTAFTLSGSAEVGARIPRAPFALSVAARSVPIGQNGDSPMSFATPVGRSQQKHCASQEVDGSPLLTLLAAASLIDSFKLSRWTTRGRQWWRKQCGRPSSCSEVAAALHAQS